ncbi:MAG TPA: hypothetical protein VFK39_01795 [Gemmatimonadaceae bacterium]|nr:hypothetical protein [Gemmatimonadaceae bacterium]
MNQESLRAAVLRAHGARGAEVDELLAYTRCTFTLPASSAVLASAASDEPFVAVWKRYAAEAAEIGVAECLRRRLVQLRFPIEAGMSATAAYRAATRKGELDCASRSAGLAFESPAEIRILVHPTAAGRVPVVICGARSDFVSLVRALVHRNEPVDVPDSMGACIVARYNNWDRIASLRARWSREREKDRSAGCWTEEFRRMIPQTELYQDSFILLSSGPYSAVPAYAMGLDASEWLGLSLTIRLEHECAHYVTRRLLGSMRNSLIDELIADYVGISAAAGRYRADWFLRFMGLESTQRYRRGGRLENYRGDPPLSDGAFTVLASLVRAAAAQLERFDSRRARCPASGAVHQLGTIMAIGALGLERVASAVGAELLLRLAELPGSAGHLGSAGQLGSMEREMEQKGDVQMTPA